MSERRTPGLERRILRLLYDGGPATVADLAAVVGSPVVRVQTAVDGLVDHREIRPADDPAKYELTEAAIVKRFRNTPKNSPTGSGSSQTPNSDRFAARRAEPLTTAGGGPSVVSLEASRDRLVLDVEGPAGLALHVVRDEPTLWESLSAALADGMPAPDLLPLPRYRRVPAVEDALAEWAERTKDGPCQTCGTRAAVPGYAPHSYADAPTPPGFRSRASGPSPLCDWCADYLSSGHSLDDLREAVGNAVTGTRGVGGIYKFASPKIVPFAFEVKTFSATPWGHLSPALRRALSLVAEQRVHPSRFVRTVGQRDSVAIPGIETPVHSGRPRPEYVAPKIATTTTYREALAEAEKRHAAQRSEFLKAHPPAWAAGGAEWDDKTSTAWYVLLETQRRELEAVDRRHPKHGDGRPRQKRAPLNPLAAAR